MASPPEQPVSAPPGASGELSGWMVRYGPAVKRYFEKKVSRAEAEDLTQEVFLAMHARSGGGRIDNIQGYLFKVAANVLARRDRSADAYAVLPDEFDSADELSPERALIGKQSMARLIVAISDLPPRCRQAFLMHRFEEMTYGAIARELGVSLIAVKRLVARAIARLDEDMGGQT